MWDSDSDPVREYHYYNQDGVFIGKSEGASPQKDLFDQAHYVFDDRSDIVKNLDLLAIAKRKLANLRKELLGVPLKDITRIIELNQSIVELEAGIEALAKSLNQNTA
ncbi:MAG: hypothetical protein CMK83_14670 [Pseudomonadales bacterium]|jgi:hypothetical protein|uniref:hypothetical protein n=1 Tax=unclassified Ketobacter TaxID=2639109 RepID=UPI000C412D72|nr:MULTISPECIES: hypothetical protein [unclassified Ketobacter]MAA59419.1 hypothetical protein [Pseudomonadales bacterium]MEC8811161.1 hypothetical protein [Pseudomonadota bacterium]TNC90203.1 MAG: hypothetical protein CSH49_03975 [Alcanivorax sp.]HAG92715.1 hypothetical protein [Gammaproteobacteria bacterium]MAQ25447.1 hypothetical protein [Pseudomonadales bacterium]|tara:strand:- start:985 stop:1305 length:321 start_codon:yes stop_codon:yes gene_type:complete